MSAAHEVEAALDPLFAEFDRPDAPGLALGVARSGVPIYRRAFGCASVELPAALTPSMRMRIGSATKQFCCLVVMLLAEEGRLSIEDSPRRTLPELPGWAEAISLQQLMSHTSGMRDSLDLIVQFNGLSRAVPEGAQFALLTAQEDVNFRPGENWSYCNGGYVLLTEIIERICGQPLAVVLQQRVFGPVGMRDTMLRPLDTDLLANSATLHVPTLSGGFSRGVFGPPMKGDGGIVSTVDDMLRWLAHMAAPTVGDAASWQALRTPTVLANGACSGYGLGVFVSAYRGIRVLHHPGAVLGGASQILKAPDHDLDVVILTNRSGVIDPTALAKRILDRLIPDAAPDPPVNRPVRLPPGAYYDAESGIAISVTACGETTSTEVLASAVSFEAGAGAWVSSNVAYAAELRALPDAEQGATDLELRQFGRHHRLAAVTAAKTEGWALAWGLEGTYACSPARVTATIRIDAETTTLHMAGPFGGVYYRLRPVTSSVWSCTTGNPLLPLGGILEFEPDHAGFRFSSVRTRRLAFKREAPLAASTQSDFPTMLEKTA